MSRYLPDPPPADQIHSGAANVQAVAAGQGFQWWAEGWQFFLREPAMWLIITAIAIAGGLFISMLPFVGTIVSTLCAPVVIGGLLYGCSEMEAGRRLSLDHLAYGFSHRTQDLVLLGAFYLLFGLVVTLLVFLIMGTGFVTAITSGGVPGVQIAIGSAMLAFIVLLLLSLPVFMASWFAPALVVLRGMSAGEALKLSLRASWANMLPFTVFGLVMMGLWLLVAMTFGLGMLVFCPVMLGAMYVSYREVLP